MKRILYFLGLVTCWFAIYGSIDFLFINPIDESDGMGSLLIFPAFMIGVFAIMGTVVCGINLFKKEEL